MVESGGEPHDTQKEREGGGDAIGSGEEFCGSFRLPCFQLLENLRLRKSNFSPTFFDTRH